MRHKIKQLNSLINIGEQKYRTLLRSYDVASDAFKKSSENISGIEKNINENNVILSDLMSSSKLELIEEYKIVNKYIKTLLDDLMTENEENNILKEKVDLLSSDLRTLKVESKGYELLVEKYDGEIVKLARDSENKELDDNWLLRMKQK